MAEITQKHELTEVVCALWFDSASNLWDSTFFGKFYERIEPLGYDSKQEQKGYQVQFEIKSDQGEPKPTNQASEIGSRMVFRNTKMQYAIIMAENFISFHKLAPYKNWESLMKEQVVPGMREYIDIGLGNNIRQVQSLYLNKYTLSNEDTLSNYFKFIPSVQDFGTGKESNLIFQSQYQLEPNLLQEIRLNSILNPATNSHDIFLQCSCYSNPSNNQNWLTLCKDAHDQNNLTFKKITKN